jgi:hypothetical protein
VQSTTCANSNKHLAKAKSARGVCYPVFIPYQTKTPNHRDELADYWLTSGLANIDATAQPISLTGAMLSLASNSDRQRQEMNSVA